MTSSQTQVPTVLVVDDDPAVTASLALLLKQTGYHCQTAPSPAAALRAVERGGVSLVLQDMNFSRRTTGEEGLALLRDLKAARPEIPVVLITAWGSIALAVEGMRAGASDFVTKPWTHQQLVQTVRTALGLASAAASGDPRGVPPTREELDERYDLGAIVGQDPVFLRALEVAGRVAATDASVLITGESGSGKELIAEALHRNSPRRRQSFVKVNLGGVPATLFESEMFGHVKGAFTDARQDRKGRFEQADGGTIFLDEIGDLEPASQVKMLRVLQDRSYELLGSSVTRTVDVRVVSATNRNLVEAVAQGRFREDLLYRIDLIAIHVPPLRERPSDVPRLASWFLERAGEAYGRPGLTLDPRAEAWLRTQPWPGNVRQLRHLIERTVLLSPRTSLGVEDFSRTARADPSGTGADGQGDQESLPNVGSMTMDEIERAMILKSLSHHGGNISKVAESLGMSRAALYRRLRKYGVST